MKSQIITGFSSSPVSKFTVLWFCYRFSLDFWAAGEIIQIIPAYFILDFPSDFNIISKILLKIMSIIFRRLSFSFRHSIPQKSLKNLWLTYKFLCLTFFSRKDTKNNSLREHQSVASYIRPESKLSANAWPTSLLFAPVILSYAKCKGAVCDCYAKGWRLI